MQASAGARYVSVSELYTADEVELLLDEIRELEPTSCRGEDIQDFEIAGSAAECEGGGRSPCTEHSWDSHAVYARAPPPPPRPLAPLYCSWPKSGAAWALLLLATCSLLAALLLGAGGARRAGAWPRALLLAAMLSFASAAALLFARLSRLDAIMPLRWDRLSVLVCACSALCLSVSAVGTVCVLHLSERYLAASHSLYLALLVASCLCGCASASAACVCVCECVRRRPKRDLKL